MRIDFFSPLAVKGKLITSENPLSTKNLQFFMILSCWDPKLVVMFIGVLLILSYPIILAISSDRSF